MVMYYMVFYNMALYNLALYNVTLYKMYLSILANKHTNREMMSDNANCVKRVLVLLEKNILNIIGIKK